MCVHQGLDYAESPEPGARVSPQLECFLLRASPQVLFPDVSDQLSFSLPLVANVGRACPSSCDLPCKIPSATLLPFPC